LTPDSRSPVFEPKLITVWKEGYTWKLFQHDAVAGLVVGVVALPLAIAFAIASGVGPERGLYTAIVAGALISILGGSRVQIGGPTGAFVVLVYAIVQSHGFDGLVVATILAGLLLVAMGLARLGQVISFIPYPVTVGFTSGIAIIIGLGQVRDFLGLDMDAVPAEFFSRLGAYADAIGTVSPVTVAIAVGTVALMRLWPHVTHRVPGSLVALLATTVAVWALDLEVQTIGSRFGAVPSHLPVPSLPDIDLSIVPDLLPAALSIALLGGIESLLSAVVADGMTGRRHRSNTELIAQGVANVVTPLFGGIPATGAIARTATNIKSGGRTPVAGIVHAVVLLVILLVLAPLAAEIPMATLAGILMVVAWNMGEWHVFRRLLRSPRSDVLVLLSTFVLTVVIDLTIAIQVGVVLAALLFMRRMANVSEFGFVRAEDEREPDEVELPPLPPGVVVFEVNGPFFFGAADRFRHAMSQIEEPPRVIILRLRQVPAIDATAMAALADVVERTKNAGGAIVLSGARSGPLEHLRRAGVVARVGKANVVPDFEAAVRRARVIVERTNGAEAADDA
jgi:SulP family sulfate permease